MINPSHRPSPRLSPLTLLSPPSGRRDDEGQAIDAQVHGRAVVFERKLGWKVDLHRGPDAPKASEDVHALVELGAARGEVDAGAHVVPKADADEGLRRRRIARGLWPEARERHDNAGLDRKAIARAATDALLRCPRAPLTRPKMQ